MQNSIKFALAAPLALALAACGGNTPAEDTAPDAGMAADAAVPVNLPTVPADARSSVNYAGTYQQSTPDGRVRSLTLNTDDTYTMRDEAGVETTGTYNWYSDNSRILIGSGADKQVYAIADGTIYKMADENAPTTGAMTADQAYVRAAAPVMSQ